MAVPLLLRFFAAFLPVVLPAVALAHAGHHHEEALWWSRWNWRLEVLLPVLLAAAIYVAGWLKLRSCYSSIAPQWQLSLYLAGLLALLTALISPIDVLAEELLSVHMVQHMLLMMIGPLFILLANPLVASLWGLPAGLRQKVARLLVRGALFRRTFGALTLMPVSWTLYVANLWAWHHPALYQLALTNERVHDLQHLLFVSTALLFWWPIVNPSPRLHGEISYGYRVIYLVAATLQNTLLGMAISLPERVLYPFYATVPKLQALAPIDDQALGGGIMWVSGHMYLIPILILMARMFAHEEDTLREGSAEHLSKRARA